MFQADQTLFFSNRFDDRMLYGMRVALIIYPILVISHAFGNGDLGTMIPHLGAWIFAGAVILTSRDAISCALFTNVFWLFFYTIYIYQTLSGVNVNTGFFDPERAARIAMISQAGLTFAHFLSPRNPVITANFLKRKAARIYLLQALEKVFLVLGLIGILGSASGALPPAVSSLMIFLFYVFVGVRASRANEHLGSDAGFWLAFALMALLSVTTNSRTMLFGFVLSSLFLILIFRHKVFSVKILLAAIILLPILSLYSEVMSSVRYARYLGIPIAPVFFDTFFNLDTWTNGLNLFATGDAVPISIEEVSQYSQYYSPVYGYGHPPMFARITLMPIMDITAARLPEWPAFTDWDTFWKIVGSALPSFGQEKELIYSDKVVWDLGLRPSGQIGRPNITAQGELFSIGGYPIVFLASAAVFWIMNIMYRAILKLTADRVVGIVILSQMAIDACFTTTLLSQVTSAARLPLLFLIMLASLMVLAQPFFSIRGGDMPKKV